MKAPKKFSTQIELDDQQYFVDGTFFEGMAGDYFQPDDPDELNIISIVDENDKDCEYELYKEYGLEYILELIRESEECEFDNQ